MLLVLPGPAWAAAGSVNDFRLPQGGSSASPVPERQGPVVPDVPESQTTPTATPSPTPAPSPRPSASATQRPAIRLPAPVPTGAPSPALAATVAAPVARPSATPVATPVPTPGEVPAAVPSFPAASPTGPQPAAPLLGPVKETSSTSWLVWALAAAALLGLLALAGWAWRKRAAPMRRETAAPVVERPRPAPSAAPPPAAATAPAPAPLDPLQVSLVPVRMSLTLVNAVLTWEAELANHGTAPLAGLTVAADMISAHADLSVEDRSSGPAPGADSQALGVLAPGERRVAGGEIRLPFPHIVPIWHGEIALLMPLLRLRVAAEGIMPVTRIFLVGQPSPTDAATLQPFRLDLGPRVYPELAQRAFA